MGTPRSGLDPVRGLPRRRTIVRAFLATALLLAAAGTWLAGTGSSAPVSVPTSAVTPDAPPPASSAPGVTVLPGNSEPSRLPVPDGMVGVPVPLGSPAATAMVWPGDRVDLLATSAGKPRLLASGAAVLAVDQPGAALLLALTVSQAHEVVGMVGSATFAVLVRP